MIQQTKKFIIFSIGGGLGALINWTITVILTELVGLWYMASYSIGLTINLIFNFLYQRHITFKVKDKVKRRFTLFTIISLSTIFLNMFLVYTLTEYLGLFYLISIIFVTIIIAIINFILNKEFVFK